jgi:hypothetical protein
LCAIWLHVLAKNYSLKIYIDEIPKYGCLIWRKQFYDLWSDCGKTDCNRSEFIRHKIRQMDLETHQQRTDFKFNGCCVGNVSKHNHTHTQTHTHRGNKGKLQVCQTFVIIELQEVYLQRKWPSLSVETFPLCFQELIEIFKFTVEQNFIMKL